MKSSGSSRTQERRIGLWLLAVCALLVVMVCLGGLTRLTHSGLSITEWRPVTGALPPLSANDWQRAFEGYQRIPEYQLITKGMTLAEFKDIYWWEWTHRLVGRLIGLVFFVPFAVFVLTRTIALRDTPRFLGLFVLGGAQGLLGWYMVKSGLSVRTDVSQYRLAAHLLLAFVIYGAIFLTALRYLAPRPAPPAPRLRPIAVVMAALVFAQVGLGALVAGLDAGFSHNTWPLMDGRLVPDGLAALSPLWRNVFENTVAVQFLHRMVAYAVLAYALWLFLHVRRRAVKGASVSRSAHILLASIALQVLLGIVTLLAVVPVWLGALHQAGALAVWTAALWHVHQCAGPAGKA